MYRVDAAARLLTGSTVHLRDDDARHAAQVARLRVGERVKVSDGRGTIATVEAIEVSATAVAAVVLATVSYPEPSPPLWLVQALAKGGRDEQAIEAAVELGVSRVIPWQAGRSVSVWRGDKATSGQARWQRIVGEATKQSMQPWWATVSPLHTTSDLASLCHTASVVVLDPEAPQLLTQVVTAMPADRPIVLVVGPEGGIGDEERDTLVAAGAVTGRLGPTVLRTSTAGPVAIALTMSVRGMWGRGDSPGQDL
jgi:16S rRNA (uracil1498-N3)-methyltransferase